MQFIKPESNSKIINANSTLGNDDGAFAMRFKNNPKAKPIKAIFGKKHIKFKHPILQWEPNYPKVNI